MRLQPIASQRDVAREGAARVVELEESCVNGNWWRESETTHYMARSDDAATTDVVLTAEYTEKKFFHRAGEPWFTYVVIENNGGTKTGGAAVSNATVTIHTERFCTAPDGTRSECKAFAHQYGWNYATHREETATTTQGNPTISTREAVQTGVGHDGEHVRRTTARSEDDEDYVVDVWQYALVLYQTQDMAVPDCDAPADDPAADPADDPAADPADEPAADPADDPADDPAEDSGESGGSDGW